MTAVINNAAGYVENAIHALKEFVSPPEVAPGLISPLHMVTEIALQTNFDTTDHKDVKRIIMKLTMILNGLKGPPATFVCRDEPGCSISCDAPVDSLPYACTKGRVFVCPPGFAEGDPYLSMIITHEVAHRIGLQRHTYDREVLDRKRKPKDIALGSADSYASLVSSLATDGPLIPDQQTLTQKITGLPERGASSI